jgi:hypothetical protein
MRQKMINGYSRKSRQNPHKIGKMLDEETMLDAELAVELGFADSIVETGRGPSVAIAALVKVKALAKLRSTPTAEWHRRIAAYVASGLSHRDAVIKVDQESPSLRMKFIAEANKRRAI